MASATPELEALMRKWRNSEAVSTSAGGDGFSTGEVRCCAQVTTRHLAFVQRLQQLLVVFASPAAARSLVC